MELFQYLLRKGLVETSATTARRLLDEFNAIYDGVITPRELLANHIEAGQFCNRIRSTWGIDAPNEVILKELKKAC